MRILVNAVAARLGGAATYLRHFLRHTAGKGHEFVVLTSRSIDVPDTVQVIEFGPELERPSRRFLFDQFEVSRISRRFHCDALLSTNNFATFRSPVRQVLMVRNPIFFSRLFLRRLAREGPAKSRIENLLRRKLILRSIAAADASVFPTRAMLEEVGQWAALPADRCHVIPHGFDADDFRRRAASHAADFTTVMNPGAFNVCFVSHYAPHKNLDTLCRGFALAVQRLPKAASPLHLWLTVDLARFQGSSFLWPADLKAFQALASQGLVTDLGTVPHERVAGLYQASQALVFPSLAESFGHPLKEAMSLELPIVASDIATHREVCGPWAHYFDATDADSLASALVDAVSRPRSTQLIDRARLSFSWNDHMDTLLKLLEGDRAVA
jgi:glycosyltransferase involved in cell wall biosynthesis